MSTLKAAPVEGLGGSHPMPFRLLFVENDVQRVQLVGHALQQHRPDTQLRHVPTLAEARTVVLAEPCELALVNHNMPDGSSLDFLGFVRRQALDLPVVVLGQNGSDGTAEAALHAGACDFIHGNLGREALDELPVRLQLALVRHQEMQYPYHDDENMMESVVLFEGLRAAMVSIKHEINNPLAIISGNAQLLLELSNILEMEEDVVRSIRDIEEASQRVSASLEKLGDLKELLAEMAPRAHEQIPHTKGRAA